LAVKEAADQSTNYGVKKNALSKYLFHLAFENDVEAWHITEKAYHAFHAGTVPVYLGPADDFRLLLPHPKAVIFVADFDYNATALAAHLTMLSHNETAYEEHRHWRTTFTRQRYVVGKPDLVTRSWHCRVCEWATHAQPNQTAHYPSQRGSLHPTFGDSCEAATTSATLFVLAEKVAGVFVTHWVVFAHLATAWVLCSVGVIVWIRRRRRRKLGNL
jgi:hypothetical protein